MAKLIVFSATNFNGDAVLYENDVARFNGPPVLSLIVMEGTWQIYAGDHHSGQYAQVAYDGGTDGDGMYEHPNKFEGLQDVKSIRDATPWCNPHNGKSGGIQSQ